jgi:hypothetical protein
MRINFNAVLKELDGTTMIEPKTVRGKVVEGEWRDITLGFVCSHALGKFVDDDKLSFKERDEQGALAVKIYDGEHELTDEERVLIKKVCAKIYNPLICHQVAKLMTEQPKLEVVKDRST